MTMQRYGGLRLFWIIIITALVVERILAEALIQEDSGAEDLGRLQEWMEHSQGGLPESEHASRTLLQTEMQQTPAAAAARAYKHKVTRIHGWLMGAAFALVFPLGIVVAHGFRGSGKGGHWWVYIHATFQVVGWLLALAGVGAAAKIELNNAPDHIHRGIGIAIEIMVGIQVLASIRRPSVQSRIRRLWNVIHWYNGRLAIAIAIGNLYYGLYLAGAATRYFIGLSCCLGGVLLILVIAELVKELHKPPPGKIDDEFTTAASFRKQRPTNDGSMPHRHNDGANGVHQEMVSHSRQIANGSEQPGVDDHV